MHKFIVHPSYVRVRINGLEMLNFRENWNALFSCNHRFEIPAFALLNVRITQQSRGKIED